MAKQNYVDLTIDRIKKHELKTSAVWKIDMRPIINNPHYGSFKSKGEAIAEMQKLCASYNGASGIEIENQKNEAVKTTEQFFEDHKTYQQKEQVTAYYKEKQHCLELLMKVKIDGLPIGKMPIERLGRKGERDVVRQAIRLALENEQIKINGTLQPSSYATKEKRRKHWVKFFAHAVERQLIDSNPILKLELPEEQYDEDNDRAPKVQPAFIEWLQTDGLQAYADAYKGEPAQFNHNNPPPEYDLRIPPYVLHVMMVCALATGMREGELRALKWSSILWDKRQIKLKIAIAASTQNLKKIKTKAGQNRKLPVSDKILQLLRKWKAKSAFSDIDDFVFPCAKGTPLRKNEFSNICKPIRDACSFTNQETGTQLHFMWGDLRHVYASNLIKRLGANWPEVAKHMGHTNASFTKKQYGHYIESEEQDDEIRDIVDEYVRI